MSNQTTNGELKIETGIPIPNRTIRSGLVHVFMKLNVGDSIFFTNEQYNPRSFHPTAKYAGIKICQRKVEGGNRVWRVA